MQSLKILLTLSAMLLAALLAVDVAATELEYFQTRNQPVDPSYVPEIASPALARHQVGREEVGPPPS